MIKVQKRDGRIVNYDREKIVRAIQKANAEGLRMIKEAGADNAVLTLKSFEALAKVADGKSTKIIIPSELQNLAGLAASLKEVVVDEKDKKEE